MNMAMRNLKLTVKSPGLLLLVHILAWPVLGHATEIFHWVDADGVHHFSESPPAAASNEVQTLQVDGSQPASYDPDEDRYNIAAQEAAMQELRDKREESRKNQQQDQQPSPPNTVVYYPQADVGNAIFYPPGYRPKPPHRPDRPDGKPDKPGTLPEEIPPASWPFRPLRPRP